MQLHNANFPLFSKLRKFRRRKTLCIFFFLHKQCFITKIWNRNDRDFELQLAFPPEPSKFYFWCIYEHFASENKSLIDLWCENWFCGSERWPSCSIGFSDAIWMSGCKIELLNYLRFLFIYWLFEFLICCFRTIVFHSTHLLYQWGSLHTYAWVVFGKVIWNHKNNMSWLIKLFIFTRLSWTLEIAVVIRH